MKDVAFRVSPDTPIEKRVNDLTLEGEDEEDELECWYSWVIVAACFVIQGFTAGIPNAFGIYIAAYQEMFPEAKPAVIVGIGSLADALLSLPGGLVIGNMISRFGYRNVCLSGFILMGTGFILASFSDHIWHLYLTQGLLVGFGCSLAYLPSISLPSLWFTKRRGLASGICVAGVGIGGLVLSILFEFLITRLGLRWCSRIIGISCIILGGLASLLLKVKQLSPKKITGSTSWDFSFVKLSRFQLLWWGCFIWGLGFLIPYYTITPYATHILGVSSASAATLLAIFNLSNAFGKIMLGYLADKFGHLNMLILSTVMCGILPVALWYPANSYPIFLIYCITNGIVSGSTFGLISPVSASFFGLEKLATTNGLLYMATGSGILIGTPIGVGLTEWLGNDIKPYTPSILFCGAASLIGSVILLTLRQLIVRIKSNNGSP